jgi:hypothetical protein
MRRVAAAKFGKRQPESNRASPSVPPGRRSLHGQKIGRATHRAGFGPPPRPRQARALIRGGAAKQVKRAREVVADLPEHIPVLPGELKVIETFLAAVVDAALEPIGLYTEKPGSEPAKPAVKYAKGAQTPLGGSPGNCDHGLSRAQIPSP